MAIIHIRDGAAVGNAVRNVTGVELVVGEVQVLQVFEVAQFAGDLACEAVGLEVQRLQVAVAGYAGRYVVLEVAVVDSDDHQVVRERAPLRGDLGAELDVPQLQSLQVLELGQSVSWFARVALVACHLVGARGRRPLYIEHYQCAVLAGDALPGAAVAAAVPAGEHCPTGVPECASEFQQRFHCV